MKIINMLGEEKDVTCPNCGNENPITMKSHTEDGITTHSCDKCGDIDITPSWRDHTEKALLDGLPPGKTRERMFSEHRARVTKDHKHLGIDNTHKNIWTISFPK